MTRAIEWSARARKDFDGLDSRVSRRVRAAIERLVEGEGDVRRLTDIDPPLFRLRVGDWRVLFRSQRATIVIMRSCRGTKHTDHERSREPRSSRRGGGAPGTSRQ